MTRDRIRYQPGTRPHRCSPSGRLSQPPHPATIGRFRGFHLSFASRIDRTERDLKFCPVKDSGVPLALGMDGTRGNPPLRTGGGLGCHLPNSGVEGALCGLIRRAVGAVVTNHMELQSLRPNTQISCPWTPVATTTRQGREWGRRMAGCSLLSPAGSRTTGQLQAIWARAPVWPAIGPVPRYWHSPQPCEASSRREGPACSARVRPMTTLATRILPYSPAGMRPISVAAGLTACSMAFISFGSRILCCPWKAPLLLFT